MTFTEREYLIVRQFFWDACYRAIMHEKNLEKYEYLLALESETIAIYRKAWNVPTSRDNCPSIEQWLADQRWKARRCA